MTLAPLWALLLALMVPFPVGTDRRGLKTPWATFALILANVVVFCVIQPESSPLTIETTYMRYGFVPQHPTAASFVTYLFIHVALLHLFWNMAFLLLFGTHVEDALGSTAFLVLYFGGGITAALCHLVICVLLAGSHPDLLAQPLVGASGAISGVLAPFAIRYYKSRMRMVWLPGFLLGPRARYAHIPGPLLVGLWLAQNIAGAVYGAVSTGSGIGYWAHLGGFAFGLIIAEVTGLLRDGRAEYLLAEARQSARDAGGTSAAAIKSFQEYIKLVPNDWRARLELAVTLRAVGTPEARQTSDQLVAEAVRQKLKSGEDLLLVYAEARRLDLMPCLTPRERLRLAGLAQDAARTDVVRDLLTAIIHETPNAAEAEMARLKLGQLLLKSAPAEAKSVLTAFLELYPESAWRDRAEGMLLEASALDRGA